MEKRKQFYKKLILFAVLVLVVNAGLNFMYDRWMYYFRLSRMQDEQFENYQGELKYLFMGNSHNRVDPNLLGNGFSYIMPKEVYRQTYYKLKYILEETGKRPQYLILSVDPVNFTARAEKELPFDGYWRKYLDYAELAVEDQDPGYLMNWFTGTFVSYAGNYKYILMSALFFNADLSTIKNGYIPARNYRNFADEPNRDAIGFAIATAYLSGFYGKKELMATRYYIRILELCRKYGVRVVGVRMPLTDEYRKYAGRVIDMKQMDADIEKLTKQYCSDCQILDYRDEFRGQPHYFFNADHVNPEGVRIISMKMKQDIR